MPLRHLMLATLLALAPLHAASARGGGGDHRGSPQGRELTAGQAGEIARRQTNGGRVLAVSPDKGGYRVKVLTPSGDVRSVFVPGR
jgi:hypothetical protein